MLEVSGTFLVPELAEVVVAVDAVEAVHPIPTEEDVGSRLDEALALDHPFAALLIAAPTEVGFEDRPLGFFDLQEERIPAVVVAQFQRMALSPLAIVTVLSAAMMEFTFGRYGTFADPLFGFGFKSVNIGNTKITGFDLELIGEGAIGTVPVTLMCGYTYIDPIQKDFDAAVDTLKNSANYNILKYRYRHLFKGDIEFNPGKFMIGWSTRFNSFMENIDAVFESDATIPGVKKYRERHDYGDWVFDARLGYRVTKSFSTSLIVRNVFNHEYMGRPADMQPPRNYALQFSMKF